MSVIAVLLTEVVPSVLELMAFCCSMDFVPKWENHTG